MDCYDPIAHVYYQHHDEYVGPRSDLRGRCVRCGAVTDPTIAGPSQAELVRQRAEARRRWEDGCETAADLRRLGLMS